MSGVILGSNRAGRRKRKKCGQAVSQQGKDARTKEGRVGKPGAREKGIVHRRRWAREAGGVEEGEEGT